MALLDVAEAADLFRDRGETDRDVVVLGRELGDEFVEQRLVVANKLPLGLALGGQAERIKRGAAQELELREQAECTEHPWTEAHLARLAGGLVVPGEKRRREMEREAQAALG